MAKQCAHLVGLRTPEKTMLKKRPGNKVVLITFLPSVTSGYGAKGAKYPTTAVLIIGTILKACGYDVTIIDGGYYNDYMKRLKAELESSHEDILFVGLSVMTTQVPLAYEVSRFVKQFDPCIPVVWGGPHPTLFPEQTVDNENVDVVVINEGMKTIGPLADIVKNGGDISTVRGIGFVDSTGTPGFTEAAEPDDINEMPWLDFSLFEVENYLNPISSIYQREFPRYGGKIRSIPILTGLGCPFQCQFCFNVILKRRYRFREAEDVVGEIELRMKEYGANTFLFLDEDFFVSRRRALDFLDIVEKKKLHFNWRMWCRVDHFNERYINKTFIERLNRIGHGSMVMGGESGNQEMLDALKKGITTQQILHSLRALQGTNITPRYSFIVGLENESLAQIKNTFNFCFRMKEIEPGVDIAGPFVFRLYPGSPIYQRLASHYQIRTPDTLEKWESFIRREETYSDMPWAPLEFRKHLNSIQFYLAHAMQATPKANSFLGTLRFILAHVSRFRVRHFLFSYPLECWLANRLTFIKR